MEKEVPCDELINLVNQALNVKDLNENELILGIRKLKELSPNFELKLDLEMKCQGYCLENGNQNCNMSSELVFIPNHKEHSVCYNCVETWVLSNFYESPLNSIFCQRCVLQKQEFPYEIPVGYISQTIIPTKVYTTYRNYFISKNYVICSECTNYIHINSAIRLSCGHFYCQKDLVSYNLNHYCKLVKETKDNFQDVIEFNLVCQCGSQCRNDPEWNTYFNFYAESYLPYLGTRKFYKKYRSFFTLENKLKLRACCKKYKLSTDSNNECFHCSRCTLIDHPIHTGLSCEEFINLPKKYEIEYKSPVYEKNAIVPKLNPLIVKNISGIEKIYKVKNKYLEVATRFKRVWEYGFIFLKNLESVNELLENNGMDSELEVFSTFQSNSGNKFLVFCEVNGFEIIREPGALTETTKRPVIVEDSKLKVQSKDQIRYLYMAHLC